MLKVSIIGLGQIGGSLGLALKSKALKGRYCITGISRKRQTLKNALKIGAIDKDSLHLEVAKDSDIIVICTPVDVIVPIYKKLVKIVKNNIVITDVSSVKFSIDREIKNIKSNITFISSHPIAGKEKNGLMSAINRYV